VERIVGDELQGQAPSENTETQPQDGGVEKFDAAYVKQLRDEAAEWRVKFKETQTQLKDLTAKSTDATQLTERLTALEAELAQKAAAADAATKQAQLLRLASKAGVDPDVAALLDLGKLNLEDEAKALEVLGKFAVKPSGQQVKPGAAGASETDAELRQRYFGGQTKSRIFGG
jgi:hypothetical protein